MWPYADHKEYMEFAKKLFDKLAKGSIFVTGEFDSKGIFSISGSSTFPNILRQVHFKHPSKTLKSGEKFNVPSRRYIFEKNY